MKNHYSISPKEYKKMDTKDLRKNFLIEQLFEKDEVNLVYTHDDRLIVGGAYVVNEVLELPTPKELAAEFFLQRREMGIINIGEQGKVIVDDTIYELDRFDGLYLGIGNKKITFEGKGAKFYFTSAPSHMKHPNHLIRFEDSNPNDAGEEESMNVRTIHQYVHPAVCSSSQLCMGLTILKPRSSWNTMPTHTHERRMEAYMYFDVNSDDQVIHLMGPKEETRHIFVKNEQVVFSPSWSIHSGVGVSNYAFIWAMAGENQEFTDMDHIDMIDMK